MPIYAYRCASCGFEQDVLQKVSEDPLTDCPSCGKPTLAKQVTAAGFQLKGSGWYVTDFRDNGKKPAEGSTSVPGPKTDAAKAAAGSSASDWSSVPTRKSITQNVMPIGIQMSRPVMK